MTVLELQEQRNALVVRMHKMVDGAEHESRDFTPEENTNYDKIIADIGALDTRIDRQLALERMPTTKVEGPGREAPKPIGRDSEQYRDAMDAWFRWGDKADPEKLAVLEIRDRNGLTVPREQRALATLNATAGGFTVAPDEQFASRLEAALSWYGGMREVATMLTTSTGADLPYPTATDTANAGSIVAENVAMGTTTDPTFSAVVFKAYKYTSNIVLVPWEMLQDSGVDIAGFLAQQLGVRIGRAQNTHFTVGSGASQPTGLMLKTVQGRAGAVGTSTSVTLDDLILLEHAVNKAYRSGPGVGWMFHDQTLRDIRRIKDGNGNYIWQPGNFQGGAPNTILGYRYTVNNDIVTMAASANSIAFGDLSKYHIRQVRDVVILRLEELYAASGQVGFVAWSRADGHLIDAGGNPVQHFTNAAT